MPAYSIGKQKKEPSFVNKNTNPGVGAYTTEAWHQQSRIRSSSSISMTKTRKFYATYNQQEYKAGPGSYNPQKLKSNISATIKGKSKTKFKTDTPSPAQYSSTIIKPSKQYSFGNSRRKLAVKDGPGPNNYTLPSQMPQNGAVFGNQKRIKQNKQKIPGPGQYNYQSLHNLQASSYTFTHEKKFKTEQAEENEKKSIPGPGNYDISNYKKKLRGGKFYQASRQCKQRRNSPGPGQYTPSKSLSRQMPRAVIGNDSRESAYKNFVPGPDKYNIPETQLTKRNYGKAAFSKSQRQLKNSSQTPGPGAYSTLQKANSKGSHIAGKTFFSKQDVTPSPQDYHPDYRFIASNSAKIAIGKSQKHQRIKTQVPGPGQYVFKDKNLSKTFYFTRAKKPNKMNSTVGPGQYKLKPYFGICDGITKQEKDILYV